MKTPSILLSLSLLITGTLNSFATSTLPATGGTNINSQTAADGPTPSWTPVHHMEIFEHGHARGDIQSGTLVLMVPEGFEIDTNITPDISFVHNKDITNTTIAVIDSRTLLITVEVDGSAELDKIHVGRTSPIMVRPTTGNPLAVGHIYRPLDGGTALLPGIIPSVDGTTGTSFGDLVMVDITPISLAISRETENCNLQVVNGNTNLLYTIEATYDLDSPSWQTVGITALGLSGLQELNTPIETAHRFYRAVRP
jgi:hypothetical protein